MRAATLGLWVMLLAGLGTTTRLAVTPLAEVTLPEAAPAPARGAAGSAGPVVVESLAAHVVERDAFRVARRPAAVAYDPQAGSQPEQPALPRPTLSLLGIVWDGGRDPTALVEGLPGIEGSRVVRRGEHLGDLRIRTIAPNHVIVLGPDTTWILTVREPWR
jgi:hypothetical protein